MRKAKQATAKNVMVLMVDGTDHVTGKVGLTLTVMASKDGAAFALITPTITERSYGTYCIALTGAHTDTLGDLALHVSAAGADPADLVLLVEGGNTDVDVSSRMATFAYTAPPSDVDNAAAVMAYIVEAGWTTEQLLRVFAAVLAGKISGAGTGTEVFRGILDDKDRVTATVDASGNRTAIALDAS